MHSAKVICLLLNPGCLWTEESIELDCQNLQHALRENLDPTKSRLLYLDQEFDWTSGSKWLQRNIVNPLGVSCKELERKFAIIEYFPYHSRTFESKLKSPLESQRYGFALVRQAIERDAVILLMRGAKWWLRDVPELVDYRRTGNCIINNKRSASLSKDNLGTGNFAKVVQALKS